MWLGLLKNPDRLIMRLGVGVEDTDETRLQKALMVSGSLMFIVAGATWGAVYILTGEPLAGAIPLGYAIVSFLSLVHFCWKRQFHFYRFSQLLLILLLPFLLMQALGGFVNSSAVIIWAFLSPVGGLLFANPRYARRWLVAYLALVLASGFLQPFLRAENNLSQGLQIAFFVLNTGTVTMIVFILLNYFIHQKDRAMQLLRIEQDKSESLLLNVLPREVAKRLKGGEQTIADYYESASILFADLSGFTPLSAQLAPKAMVEVLNEIYSHFDSLVEKHGVEKIRTIGDNYMIAAGLPRRRPDHAAVLARLALEMNAYLDGQPPVAGHKLRFRIGINSGPVIAGVIGRKKFAYDVWGDTVNTASRMESHGEPGKIQITRETYELILDEFLCEKNSPAEIKGKGWMETWFLLAVRE